MVEFEDADFLQGEILLIPHFGQIEGVVGQLSGLFLSHQLNKHRPFGEVTLFNGSVQVALMGLAVIGNDQSRFLVRQVLHTLLAAEVELDPSALIVGIDQAVGVAGEAVHMTI